MLNSVVFSDEQELKFLVESLQSEKLRYNQEKLAKKISCIRNERTAELISDLFHADDAYIRNIAIEILVTLGESALQALKEKASDQDRNIRKFALDALKNITGKQSCDIAMTALDDSDDNVVEAALEIINHQKYKGAEDKLLIKLKEANSIWIINELIRTFASLESKHLTRMIEQKIYSLNTTDIEKTILVNTYVKALGSIGTGSDIPLIIYKYSKEFIIDEDSFIFALRSLAIKEDISKLTAETTNDLGRILKEHWDFKESEQLLHAIAAFVKLQMNFFLDDIEEMFNLNKDVDFFAETLFELVKDLQTFPDGFLYELLASKEAELIVLGLKLAHEKNISIEAGVVEALCNSREKDVAEWAVKIVSNIDPIQYKQHNSYDKSNIDIIEDLMLRLEHKSIDIRKAAAQKLIPFHEKINVELLEEIIKCNPAEEGMEALETLFSINESRAWNYITSRMDSSNESVRARLIEIVKNSQDMAFNNFMTTMINDPSKLVRRRAIKALNNRVSDRSLSLLMELYSAESDSVNKMEIISNLFKFDNDIAINMINDAAFSSDTLVKLAAVKALSHICNRNTVNILKRMLDDQVEEVQEAAKEAMSNLEVTE